MKRKISFFIVLNVIAVSLSLSCAAAPKYGAITESTSDHTGVTELKMEPALLHESTIRMALFKTSKMRKDDVILAVVIKGKRTMPMGDSLYFIIDGQGVSFKSMDLNTNFNTTEGFYGSGIEFPTKKWTTRDYLISKGLVKRLIDAENVTVKVKWITNSVEGIFSHDAPTLARPAFREFYEKMKAL